VADIQWLINGVDAATWGVQRDTNWTPPVVVRSNLMSLPGKDGALVLDSSPIFDEPKIPFKFTLRARKQANLEELANALKAHLAHPNLTLTRVSGGLTTSARARLESIALADFLVGRKSDIHAILAIPGVFMRGAISTCAQKVSSDTWQVIENLTGSTGPITDAVIQVLGPATTVSITDSVNGTGFTWAGTLASGQYLYLNPANLGAWVSSSATAWTAAAQNGTVDYPAPGVLRLIPDGAKREVKAKVLIGGSNSATTKWLIRAGKSYV